MTVAEIRLWGRVIGAVAWDDEREIANFEYDKSFITSGIQISPFAMPLSNNIYSFPALNRATFKGLPGLLADSLPDKFGNALLDAWLARQGKLVDRINSVERLCYVGKRGMGALEFHPSVVRAERSTRIEIDELVKLAGEILTQRGNLKVSFADTEREEAIKDILRVGTSAGGARAKAVIAWNPKTNEVKSGQVKAADGFSYWLIKFDGVKSNKDKELEDPQGYGLIEYAYYKMALDAGIEMSECRVLEENSRQHFMTKRFDRTETGGKIHMQSLCALKHYDFNQAGAYSYEQALQTIRELGLSTSVVEEQFRRMTFNIMGRNQDDHVKNIAFLMDKTGQWSLAPAFDVVYSYNPQGQWTASHQMTMNGKRDGFTVKDFKQCAALAALSKAKVITIIDQVQHAISRWPLHAKAAGVPRQVVNRIDSTLRKKIT